MINNSILKSLNKTSILYKFFVIPHDRWPSTTSFRLMIFNLLRGAQWPKLSGISDDFHFYYYYDLLAPSRQAIFFFRFFRFGAMLPIYTFINHFHVDSVFNEQNKTRQYFCMNYIDNACMQKFLQTSTRLFTFL